MPSPSLESTHGQQRRAWRDITALGPHTRLDDVERGMPSSPLGSTNSQTTSGVACHHRIWTISHNRTASGMACHHRYWMANTIKRRRAWYAIIALGKQTRSATSVVA